MTAEPTAHRLLGYLHRAGRRCGGLRAAAVAGDPGAAHHPGGPAHLPEHRDLGADRLPAVRVDLHAHHRPSWRHVGQGADAGRRADCPDRRIGTRRPDGLDRRDDRGPGDPGHRRRRAAAVLRHHPRRVPGAEGGRRSRRDRGAGRGRSRTRHRARRPDRRGPELPLAVLDPGDHAGRRDRRREADRAGIAGSDRRPAELGRPLSCCRAGSWPCWCRSARRPAWGWGSARVLGLLAVAVVLAAAGSWSSPGRPSRWSTCA